MSRRFRKLLSIVLGDPNAERVRQNTQEAILELQGLPFAGAVIVSSVELANGVATVVSHGLGRAPSFVRESIPRGAVAAGFIVETRDGSVDRTKQLKLTASGYGATITVDLVVA